MKTNVFGSHLSLAVLGVTEGLLGVTGSYFYFSEHALVTGRAALAHLGKVSGFQGWCRVGSKKCSYLFFCFVKPTRHPKNQVAASDSALS